MLIYLKEILEAYVKKFVSLSEALNLLGLSRAHFFRYLKVYRLNPDGIIVSPSGNGRKKFCIDDEKDMEEIIKAERSLIDAKNSGVNKFNFCGLANDLLRCKAIAVSSETLRRKAIKLGFHVPKRKGAKIYREVITTKIGRLFQHDTCIHQWSPYMEPFYLILTVDDHSRRIVYAKFFEKETSMNHILSVRDIAFKFGLPLAYYTDKHSIFTYNERESYKYRFQTKTEDAAVQWQRVMRLLDIQPILANSPQAKGKVESKFKYLQGRVVRRCAKEEVKTIKHAQRILDEEIRYYNEHKKHKITGQTPKERWEMAEKEGKTVMRKFNLQKENSWKDIFCLEYDKKLDSYGRTKVKGIEIKVKKASSKKVTIHYIEEYEQTEIRVFAEGELISVIK